MLRCALKALVPLIFAVFASACSGTPSKPVLAAAAPPPTPQAGEQTHQLPLSYGAPNPPGVARRAEFTHAVPSDLTAAPDAAANGTVYYSSNGELIAFDLRTAAVRWRRAVDALAQTFAATPHSVVFQGRADGELTSLDAATGAMQFTIPHAKAAGSIDGVLFAQDYQNSIYVALDERTGRRLWKSYGGGTQVNGAPVMHDGMLLQPYVDDGAILENALYAFDPSNGHARWRWYAMNTPIGYRGSVSYVDATWFPEQLDNYVPLTVEALDTASGKRLDSYTYAPDPQQNSATYRNSPMHAYVTGGYVYLRVNGTWYRYDADTEPASAHPSRLAGLDIAAAFNGGALLVTSANRTYVARGEPSRMLLRPLGDGELRSALVRASSSTSYAVIGTLLYRFNAGGGPKAIGAVRCADSAAIYPWPGDVAVVCDNREMLFSDVTQPAAKVAVAPERAPSARLVLHAFPIPTPEGGFIKQWWVGPLAPYRDNGVVMALDRGSMNLAGSIGFVSKTGHIGIVATGHDIVMAPPTTQPLKMPAFPPPIANSPRWPPKPTAVVYDSAGSVWFNDVWFPEIGKIDANGHITSSIVGAMPHRGRTGAVRLALGPDGRAWFARPRPINELVRADGSRTLPIPEYANVLAFTSDAGNGFWLVNGREVGHLALAGTFTAAALPPELRTIHNDPPVVARGSHSLWIARGSYIAQMNERGLISHYALPDATLGVQAMITACDGSLYVAETAPEVLRLPPGGSTFERYSIDYRQLDGFTRTPDCTIWFVEGSNMPKNEQRVGTLSLEKR